MHFVLFEQQWLVPFFSIELFEPLEKLCVKLEMTQQEFSL